MEQLHIRGAKKEDVEAIAELIVRTKRLNSEFDPLFVAVSRGGSIPARVARPRAEPNPPPTWGWP